MEHHYEADHVGEALRAFRALRSRTSRLLKGLPEAAWVRVLRRPEGGQRTVEEELQGYPEHDDLHLRQIEQIVGAL
jgi:hypothetical protein